MKFTREDNIVNAKWARERSKFGVEDSIPREEIRRIMNSIRFTSGYGYTKVESTHNIRPLHEETVIELDKLGYKARSTETMDIFGKRWTWTIDWSTYR